jgi:hypothetical protein
MAATTFHRFSELPAELRDEIWELALPGPARRHPKLLLGGIVVLRSPPPQTRDPAMLQVNRESRAIAMQFYNMRDYYNCRYGKFFNFEVDSFYFAGKDLPSTGWTKPEYSIFEDEYNISVADRRKIKNITLAFPWSFALGSPFIFVRKTGQAFFQSLITFENVKAVTIEIWQDDALDIMDIMAPRMPELNVSTNRMLRQRLAHAVQFISRCEDGVRPDWKAPEWRIQMVQAGNER